VGEIKLAMSVGSRIKKNMTFAQSAKSESGRRKRKKKPSKSKRNTLREVLTLTKVWNTIPKQITVVCGGGL